DAGFGHADSDVVSRRDGQGENALPDAVKINSDLRRLLLISRLRGVSFLLFSLSTLLLVSLSPFLPLFLIFGHFLFVAFGREGRRLAFLPHNYVYAAGRLMWQGRHVEPAGAGAGVAAGCQVEMLAVLFGS